MVFEQFLQANNRLFGSFNNFFTFEQQQKRLSNVAKTFGVIGNNVLNGNFLRGVPVSEELDDTILARVATGISSPAAIVTLPAVAGAAGLAIRGLPIGSGARALSKLTADNVLKFTPSVEVAKRLGALGLAGAGVVTAARLGSNLTTGGLPGLFSGSNQIGINRQREINNLANQDAIDKATKDAIIEQIQDEGAQIGTNDQGQPIILTSDGQIIPIPTNIGSSTTQQPTILGQATDLSKSLVPLALIVVGGIVVSNLTKKRK